MENSEPILMTINEVCQLLRCSRSTFFRKRKSGDFPVKPIGLFSDKEMYYKPEIIEYLLSCRLDKFGHEKVTEAQ